MSKKTIAIQIPQKQVAEPASRELVTFPPQAASEAEQWVSQVEPSVEAAREKSAAPFSVRNGATLTFSISAEPDWFEAVKIGMFLPYAAFSLWAFAATQRNFRLFGR
jgi:hypothetical protein